MRAVQRENATKNLHIGRIPLGLACLSLATCCILLYLFRWFEMEGKRESAAECGVTWVSLTYSVVFAARDWFQKSMIPRLPGMPPALRGRLSFNDILLIWLPRGLHYCALIQMFPTFQEEAR